ncbi:hypothetical protein Hanom_Chr03g00248481 [Helianthus anomalus]
MVEGSSIDYRAFEGFTWTSKDDLSRSIIYRSITIIYRSITIEAYLSMSSKDLHDPSMCYPSEQTCQPITNCLTKSNQEDG